MYSVAKNMGLDSNRLQLKFTGSATYQPHGSGQVRNFFEHMFLICKMEMTSVAISEDYKREHYKAPSTEYGRGGALYKQ